MHLNPPGAELGKLEEPTRGFPLNVRNVEKLVGLNGGRNGGDTERSWSPLAPPVLMLPHKSG